MPFRYLRDPLFLCCVGLYIVNRLVLKPATGGGFLHSHLNDLICVPMWAPVVVFVCRRIGGRPDDAVPQPHELLTIVILWSVLFEIMLPSHPFWSRYATRDPLDVLCYAAGALIGGIFWNAWYPLPQDAPDDVARCSNPTAQE
jgi:hypothetical protein